jgi:hypothetical protein
MSGGVQFHLHGNKLPTTLRYTTAGKTVNPKGFGLEVSPLQRLYLHITAQQRQMQTSIHAILCLPVFFSSIPSFSCASLFTCFFFSLLSFFLYFTLIYILFPSHDCSSPNPPLCLFFVVLALLISLLYFFNFFCFVFSSLSSPS